ncbi:hypothetical protein N7470_004160 [Penicillium chermesinum]|nr:hypothetical protein N7470_004160 [Penicillium chermesinum]
MSSPGQFASPPEVQRRQFSSCDPCRRSKRRCFFPSDVSIDSNISCAHCARLGHTCTFNFATSRLSSRPRKRQRQNKSKLNQVSAYEYDGHLLAENSSETLGKPQEARLRTPNTSDDDFAAWLNFDIENYFANDLQLPATAEPTPLGSEAQSDSQHDRRLSLLPNQSQSVKHVSYGMRFVPGSSPRSPIHLLNSKLDTRILNERLISIYDAVLTGSATRFLDYDINLYATRIRYKIENSRPGSSNEPIPARLTMLLGPDMESSTSSRRETESLVASLNSSGQLQSSRSPNSRDQAQDEAYRVTIVGCARFLDHFGDLYGNRIRPPSKRKSDAALNAALRLFALQWLPSRGSEGECWTSTNEVPIARFCGKQSARSSPCHLYTDAWYQARVAIEDAKSVRSFQAVFAILIFDGAAIPMSALIDSNKADIEHGFLNLGLQMLRELDELVQNYCTTLGPSSHYGALAEASLSVVRWGGYIRDTGAALTSNHQCQLPDPRCNEIKCDRTIPDICRRIASEAFYIWRKIADVKNDLRLLHDNSQHINSELLKSINSVVTVVGKIDENLRPFIKRCRDIFWDLSLASRVSCVSLVVPWNSGVLVLAEALEPFVNPMSHILSQEIGQSIRTHEREAVSSVAQMIECVLALPIEETFNVQHGLAPEAPITAYHLTPSVITTALGKAVVHTINLQFFSSPGLGKTDGDPDFSSDGSWRRQIDCLMKGLVSLDVTIGGSQTFGLVMRSLMQEYGDIISECWSCDFNT